MSGILYVLDDQKLAPHYDDLEAFKNDVLQGLRKLNKQIPSKYFYDAQGSALFDQITRHPDYYLTSCELEILDTYKKQLAMKVGAEPFNLIELGPGEGIKTRILVEQFLHDSLSFTYTLIDISKNYLEKLIAQYNRQSPQLELIAINSDYFKGIQWINTTSKRRNMVLFLGSSIGNFDIATTKIFLRHLWDCLHAGDYVLIGFDLRKAIDILMRAYNDSDGITRDFNLNLLQRMNRELGANFRMDKFSHYEAYNVYSGAMESHLVSLESQIIDIDTLASTFTFEPFEGIHVEYSHKYLLTQIAEFAYTTGFEIVQNFTDSQHYFVDSLWRVVKRT
jgi:L-histidine N-alpha-methyltransferase